MENKYKLEKDNRKQQALLRLTKKMRTVVFLKFLVWMIPITRLSHTRSLGALRAPTFSWGPFGPGLRPSRPSGAQAARPTQVTQPTHPTHPTNLTIFRKYRSQVVRNTVWSFWEIHMTMFVKYSKKRSDPDFLWHGQRRRRRNRAF